MAGKNKPGAPLLNFSCSKAAHSEAPPCTCLALLQPANGMELPCGRLHACHLPLFLKTHLRLQDTANGALHANTSSQARRQRGNDCGNILPQYQLCQQAMQQKWHATSVSKRGFAAQVRNMAPAECGALFCFPSPRQIVSCLQGSAAAAQMSRVPSSMACAQTPETFSASNNASLLPASTTAGTTLPLRLSRAACRSLSTENAPRTKEKM